MDACSAAVEVVGAGVGVGDGVSVSDDESVTCCINTAIPTPSATNTVATINAITTLALFIDHVYVMHYIVV